MQKLFDEAVEELDQANYTSACPKLEKVTRLAPEGAGAKETLGECYEKQGRLASAWKQYTRAAELFKKQSKPDRAKEADRQAARLARRLPAATVEAAEKVPGLVLQIDGETVPDSQLGTAIFLDSGPHTVLVSAPGYTPFSKSFTLTGDAARVTVTVPALTRDTTPHPETTPAAGQSQDKASSSSARFIGGIAASGLGVTMGVLGVVSSVQVADAQSALDPYRGGLAPGAELCMAEVQSGLPAGARKTVQDACGKAVFVPLQFVFYGLGAALAGTGIYLLVTSRPASSTARAAAGNDAPTLWLEPAAGPTGASFTLRAAF